MQTINPTYKPVKITLIGDPVVQRRNCEIFSTNKTIHTSSEKSDVDEENKKNLLNDLNNVQTLPNHNKQSEPIINGKCHHLHNGIGDKTMNEKNYHHRSHHHQQHISPTVTIV